MTQEERRTSGDRARATRIATVGRFLAREGGELATAFLTVLGVWWYGVVEWFRFVHHRRSDTRFPVFPSPMRIAEAAAVAASAIAIAVLVADPMFLAAMASVEGKTGGIFGTITWFGKTDWILYPTGIALICFSLWRRGWIGRRSVPRWHAIMLAIYYLFTAIALSGLIALMLKNLIGRARPPFVSPGEVWESVPFGDSYDFASFPSGHATTAGALAIALALLFPRLRVFFLLAGTWIAVSRPALGVHFPSDILAGFALGAGFSYYYARSFARKRLLFAFDDNGRLRLSRRQGALVAGPLGDDP